MGDSDRGRKKVSRNIAANSSQYSFFSYIFGRWCLFPPSTDLSKIGMQDPQIPSAIWFSSEWYQKAMELVPGAIEILQKPGETVYVPAGWPHLVLNLEFSTAITQNYATEYPSFSRILKATEEEEPEMCALWKNYLQNERPDIWEQYARDSFDSVDDVIIKCDQN